MMYPKIQTLWKRNPDTGIIIPNNYSRKEFRNIKWWHVTEKIDGMNIRIEYSWYDSSKPTIMFKGRTDNAILPKPLLDYLQKTFTIEMFIRNFPNTKYVCLFGEGYGYKIQKGGNQYNPNQEFVLFDIFVDGWWLQQYNVTIFAEIFNIPRVSELGIWTKDYAIDFIDPRVKNYAVKYKTVDNVPLSILAIKPKEMEGIMCRSHPLMLYRNKSPIIFKLKVKDFRNYIK